MSNPISGPDAIRRFGRDERGEAAVGFALTLPMLVLLSLGTLEFTLGVFDYHRAGEATRRGARVAAIEGHMVSQATLQAAGSVTCTSTSGTVGCGGAAALSPETFIKMVDDMKAILPTVTAENVEVEYRVSGLGDATTPGGLIPMVSVRLKNLRHEYLMLAGLPGMDGGYTFKPMMTSRMASGMGSAGGGV